MKFIFEFVLLFGVLVLRTTAENSEEVEYVGPIRKCKSGSDKIINECIHKIIMELKPRMGAGIPEIGLKPLDPFYLDKLKFHQGQPPIIIKALLTNTTIHHLTNFRNEEFKLNSKEKSMYFNLEIPRIRLEGTYRLDGNILLFQVGGTGPYEFDVENAKARGTLAIKHVKKEDGTVIMQVDTMKMDLVLGGIKMNLMNLFNGNQILGPVINNVLNENSQQLFKEVKPEIVKIVMNLAKEIVNPIIASMPFLAELVKP